MELSQLERPARDPRIEAYLDQVVTQLPRRMSPACRLEHRAELAAHLEALVDAHIELGNDEETAALGALQRFGSAKELGRQLSREWKRSARLRAPVGELVAAACTFLYTSGLFLFELFPEWPAAALGPGAVGRCLDLLAPCFAGYHWGGSRSVTSRSLGIILFAGLLAAALLPLQQDCQGVPALQLFARVLLLMKWLILLCSTAGLTAALRVLGECWKKRQVV
jgi:hypothetical protein